MAKIITAQQAQLLSMKNIGEYIDEHLSNLNSIIRDRAMQGYFCCFYDFDNIQNYSLTIKIAGAIASILRSAGFEVNVRSNSAGVSIYIQW